MRFVGAVVAFVLAAILIGAGIAQRTVFAGPKTEDLEISLETELPFTVIDGSVLAKQPGAQTVSAVSTDATFAAYGRTADMHAWLADVSYNQVTLDDEGAPSVRVVEPAEDPVSDAVEDAIVTDDSAVVPEGDAGDSAEATTDVAEVTRSPAGSDLWLEELVQENGLSATVNLPEEMSLLIAVDGALPAPTEMKLSWAVSNATPWAGPLIVMGSILMAAGIVLYFLGIRNVQRSRGPRRKGLPPLPVTEPLDTLPEAEKKGVITSGTAQSRAKTRHRRAWALLPLIAVPALVLTGCFAEAWPQIGATPTPSQTPTVVDADSADAPAVTERQAQRILANIAQTVAEADAAGDADLAATRLGGAVLEERKANYTIRAQFSDYPASEAIPTQNIGVTLPQSYDGWPRTVMLVVGEESDETGTEPEVPADTEATVVDDPAAAPAILLMTQEDPWSDYKITHFAHLAASTVLPGVAGATVGAVQVPPDTSLLLLPPDQVAAAYADVINKGAESEYAGQFTETDEFRTKLSEKRTEQLDLFNQTGAETGTMEFSSAAGDFDTFSLATLESGAIVAVSLTETETVRSTNPDAVIKIDGNRAVQSLSGTTSSATGFQTNHSDQLFFYVPSKASGEKIELLGFGSNILNAGVIQ